MGATVIDRRVLKLSLACLIALLGLLAVVALAVWHGTGSPAEAGVVDPVVQVTPEDSHFYDRPTLVETASGTLVVVYRGHVEGQDHGLYTKSSTDGGAT